MSIVLALLTRTEEALERLAARVVSVFQSDSGVVGTMTFRRRLQADGWSCGSRSAQAIAQHFGRDVSHDEVKARVGTTTDGTAATPIVRYMRKLGLRAGYHRCLSLAQLVSALARGGVVLVDIGGTHWAVVYAVSCDDARVWIADPSLGSQLGRRVSLAWFASRWTGLGVTVSRRGPRR